ncbi:Gfo/Idh/MocA family protein [Granulicella sibirica]|uniref:Maltose/maltodextrin ABC transporter, substrate binding periplasmic protein MalE n=1 Tax=Granulicella sibirica TaxID=2479048 RepID=A0A4Q0T8C5_9BACT|nr:Gfo/Idh/MocA family oxidoreductase [Granulicella sibirica]RXH58289.1 Maltose/maltodextrin ABC transporter, substrate binding periplasmic protein MalE [Granulicella sibirica]
MESPNAERYRQAVASAAPPRPKTPRPIVTIGSGGIIRDAHLPAYAKAGFPVIALSDRTPGVAAKLAAEAGIARSFDSVEAAIAFAPKDAVFDIAVPASQIQHILPLLPKGAAVLIQKPMGDTLEQARTIRDLCRNRGLTAAVNFQLRYAPNNLGAVALAKAGLLGEIHDMEVQVRVYMPWKLWTFLSTAPRLEILYHSIHYLDLIRSWLGNPVGVYARTVRNPQTPTLAATKSTILLDYGDWKRVFVVTNHGHDLADTSQRSFVQWEGTGGAIRMDMGVNLDYPTGRSDTLSYIERDSPTKQWHDLPVSGNWFPDAFMGSMGALQAYVEGSAPDLPTGFESAYETMALVEAAYESSALPTHPLLID